MVQYLNPTGNNNGTSLLSHTIPECYIKNITLSGGSNGAPLKAVLSLCVTDVIEDDLVSNWIIGALESDSDFSPLEEFVRISIFQVCNKDLDHIFNKKMRLTDSKIPLEEIYHGSTVAKFNLRDKIPHSLKSGGLGKYKKINSEGKTILEFPIEQTFSVVPYQNDPRGVKYLSYYIWADLDLDAMAEKMDISAQYIKNKNKTARKNPRKELIIEEYNTITYTNVYTTAEGKVWNGNMFYSEKDKSWAYYGPAGVNLLTETAIQNQKIKDFRLVHRTGQKYVSVMDQRIAAGLRGQRIDGKNILSAEDEAIFSSLRMQTKNLGSDELVKPEKGAAMFSPLWTSSDEMHHNSSLFCFNWGPFLKENSAHPWMWDISEKTTNKLLQIAKIISVEIKRLQVDTNHRSSNRLDTPHLPMVKKELDGAYKEVLLANASQMSGKPLTTVNNDVCFLKETKIGLNYKTSNHATLRWFTMTDREIISQKNGQYQYTILVKALDPTVTFLRTQIERLREAKLSLSQYLNMAEGYTGGKMSYDIYANRFTNEFIRSMSAQNHLWTEPMDTYLNVLDYTSGILEQQAYHGASYSMKTALPAAISSYVDPRKGSPEGILILLELVDRLERSLSGYEGTLYTTSTKYGSKGWVGLSNRTTEGSGVEKKTPKSLASDRVIEHSHTFNVELHMDGQRGMGYDYLTNQTNDFIEESVKGAGLRTISARYFRKRCDIETQRFYSVANDTFSWNEIKSGVPDLTLTQQGTGDSLDSTKYSYLSPAFVFSSPGMSLPGLGAFGGALGSSAPPPSTGGSSGARSSNSKASPAVPTFSTSYAFGSTNLSSVFDKSSLLQSMKPVGLLPHTLQLSLAAAPSPKTLDDLVADVAAQQGNPDMSLYPVSIDAYQDPSIHKDSPLPSEQQILKSKYVGILGMQSCVLVPEEEEFDEIDFHTRAAPYGYSIDTVNFGKEPRPVIPEAFLQSILKMNKFTGFGVPVWKSSVPMLKGSLAKINPVPLMGPLVQSLSFGLKTGGMLGKISYNSMHMSNFKLLDFSDKTTPNILTNVNPSLKVNVLKALPNSFKSLALSNQNFVLENVFDIPNLTDRMPSGSLVPPIYDPKNMQKLYQLFHNTMRIEYLDSFAVGSEPSFGSTSIEKTKGTNLLLKAPEWKLLNQQKILQLEEQTNATALLCRLTRYKNKPLGVGSDKLQLPIIDEHFLLLIDPSADTSLGISQVEDEVYASESTDLGDQGHHGTDADIDSMELFPDLSGFRYLEVDGQQLLVKEFEGSVVCGEDG